MMGDRLGEEIVEAAAIGALGGGIVNFERGGTGRPASAAA